MQHDKEDGAGCALFALFKDWARGQLYEIKLFAPWLWKLYQIYFPPALGAVYSCIAREMDSTKWALANGCFCVCRCTVWNCYLNAIVWSFGWVRLCWRLAVDLLRFRNRRNHLVHFLFMVVQRRSAIPWNNGRWWTQIHRESVVGIGKNDIATNTMEEHHDINAVLCDSVGTVSLLFLNDLNRFFWMGFV